jgi:hypothetical protein
MALLPDVLFKRAAESRGRHCGLELDNDLEFYRKLHREIE